MTKLHLNEDTLITAEIKRQIKKTIVTTLKIDNTSAEIAFLNSDLQESILNNDFAKVAEYSAQIAKLAKSIEKLKSEISELGELESLVLTLAEKEINNYGRMDEDWIYIANKFINEIEEHLFNKLLNRFK